ncbi:MAG: non-ribosomal peptide synthetase, partial [Methylocystis sp.]|nr:non-ribosomal peptide synthetase [Methylocystis sp.]
MATPADLARGPLCAFAVFKISAISFFFYHRYHHIAWDGFSLARFGQRVGEVYASLNADAPQAAKASGSWLDVIDDEESYKNSPRNARDRDYWMARLADRPPPATLSGRPPAVVPPRGFIRATDFLPYSAAEKLRAVGAACGASLAQVFTAAAGLYLHRF